MAILIGDLKDKYDGLLVTRDEFQDLKTIMDNITDFNHNYVESENLIHDNIMNKIQEFAVEVNDELTEINNLIKAYKQSTEADIESLQASLFDYTNHITSFKTRYNELIELNNEAGLTVLHEIVDFSKVISKAGTFINIYNEPVPAGNYILRLFFTDVGSINNTLIIQTLNADGYFVGQEQEIVIGIAGNNDLVYKDVPIAVTEDLTNINIKLNKTMLFYYKLVEVNSKIVYARQSVQKQIVEVELEKVMPLSNIIDLDYYNEPADDEPGAPPPPELYGTSRVYYQPIAMDVDDRLDTPFGRNGGKSLSLMKITEVNGRTIGCKLVHTPKIDSLDLFNITEPIETTNRHDELLMASTVIEDHSLELFTFIQSAYSHISDPALQIVSNKDKFGQNTYLAVMSVIDTATNERVFAIEIKTESTTLSNNDDDVTRFMCDSEFINTNHLLVKGGVINTHLDTIVLDKEQYSVFIHMDNGNIFVFDKDLVTSTITNPLSPTIVDYSDYIINNDSRYIYFKQAYVFDMQTQTFIDTTTSLSSYNKELGVNSYNSMKGSVNLSSTVLSVMGLEDKLIDNPIDINSPFPELLYNLRSGIIFEDDYIVLDNTATLCTTSHRICPIMIHKLHNRYFFDVIDDRLFVHDDDVLRIYKLTTNLKFKKPYVE